MWSILQLAGTTPNVGAEPERRKEERWRIGERSSRNSLNPLVKLSSIMGWEETLPPTKEPPSAGG
jgi:hypothetical protein